MKRLLGLIAIFLIPLLVLNQVNAAEPVTGSIESRLVGEWIQTTDTNTRYLVFEPNGTLSVLAGKTQSGVNWARDNGQLVLRRRADKNTEISETRFAPSFPDADTLVLDNDDSDLAGSWTRSTGKLQSVRGLFTYKKSHTPPATSIAVVRLINYENPTAKTASVTQRVLPMTALKNPVDFVLHFDPAELVTGKTFAIRVRIYQGETILLTNKKAIMLNSLKPGKPAAIELVPLEN